LKELLWVEGGYRILDYDSRAWGWSDRKDWKDWVNLSTDYGDPARIFVDVSDESRKKRQEKWREWCRDP
jgi:hypothetical protein